MDMCLCNKDTIKLSDVSAADMTMIAVINNNLMEEVIYSDPLDYNLLHGVIKII